MNLIRKFGENLVANRNDKRLELGTLFIQDTVSSVLKYGDNLPSTMGI